MSVLGYELDHVSPEGLGSTRKHDGVGRRGRDIPFSVREHSKGANWSHLSLIENGYSFS